jgi:protein required for attachment to host cells
MSKYIVLVADAKRARLFTVKESLTPEIESSPRLIEEQAILNTDTANGSKPRGTPASGRNKSGSGGSYAFDDHRGKHELDELRRFACIVVKETFKQARKASAHTLILAAERKTLGVIRDAMANIKLNGYEILECDRELTGESPSKIQELLARRKLVPAVKKPSQRLRK